MLRFLLLPLWLLSLVLNTEDGGSGANGESSGESSGDTNGNQGEEAGKTKSQAANAGGESGGADEGFKAITSQEDFDAAIQKRLTRQEASLRKTISEQVRADLKAEAGAKTAKEQGDFKALYEAEVAKRESAERDLATERHQALRRRIAAKHKLPDELASRLSGETEEDLDADAKALAKLVKAPEAAENEGGRKRKSGSDNGAKLEKIDLSKQSYTFLPAGAVPIPD